MVQPTLRKLAKTCRMCLSENTRKKYLCINDKSNIELRVKFEKCFRVIIFKKPQKLTFLCTECADALDSFVNLQRRVRRNDKVYSERLRKRYRCDQCDYYSCKKSVLKRHVEYHHLKVNLPTCDLCGKNYCSKQRLNDHKLNKHTVGYNFKCKECPRKFKLQRYLNRHFRVYHT